uniref:Plasma membrane proteolipid 3 n=1 Tax=Parascaris univalens TaxID=6257 RepID=A0A915ACT6_PARUN
MAGGTGGEQQVRIIDNRRDTLKLILLIVLVIFFPPAAVAIQANECNIHVWISLLLMLFFVFPAYIHAIWYCFIRKDPLHSTA